MKKRRPVVLNDSRIKALRPEASVYRVADIARRGFLVTVYPSGRKVYQYRYRLNGRQQTTALGDVGKIDLADAHAEYDRFRALVKKGADPKAPIIVSGDPDDPGPTFGEVAETWYSQTCLAKVKNSDGRWVRHPNRKALKAPQYKRLQLDNHLLPKWKEKAIRSITRIDANRRLDEIIAAGSPVMANRVGATIGQIWGWALDEGIIDATPMQALGKRGGREIPRERILNDNELKRFWRKLDTSGLTDVTVAALKVCLLTGARRSEVAGAKWKEIREDLWTVPPSRIKTEHRKEKPKPHKVPLSDKALEVLETVKGLDKSAIFPSPAGGFLRPHALSRAVNRKLKHFGIGKFTPHDLRRTLRSKLPELGVQPVVAKKVLNHALEGMDAIYDRYDYFDEKRDALQKWADHLKAIVEGRSAKGRSRGPGNSEPK
ncbi:MAG TPA: tyrosine-type recombinase/integrase [Gammaproteobacteria bacterium]|jgi:integrase